LTATAEVNANALAWCRLGNARGFCQGAEVAPLQGWQHRNDKEGRGIPSRLSHPLPHAVLPEVARSSDFPLKSQPAIAETISSTPEERGDEMAATKKPAKKPAKKKKK
jgi:hypothetical protein